MKPYPGPKTAAEIGLREGRPYADLTVDLETPYARDRVVWGIKEAIEQARVLVELDVPLGDEFRRGLAWLESEFYPYLQRSGGGQSDAPRAPP